MTNSVDNYAEIIYSNIETVLTVQALIKNKRHRKNG